MYMMSIGTKSVLHVSISYIGVISMKVNIFLIDHFMLVGCIYLAIFFIPRTGHFPNLFYMIITPISND